MFKIDLHTHSNLSPDGGITPAEYKQALSDGLLDVVAVTDHNTVNRALELKKQLGDAIIVGEEIMTSEGEIIGLYLKKTIKPGLSLDGTIKEIKNQSGLVYVPHPFETVRKGISRTSLERIIKYIDIIEIFNGRAVFQNKGPEATTVARLSDISGASSSDAHGAKGLGTAYCTLSKKPKKEDLVELLKTARFSTKRPPLKTLLYPKVNRIKKRLSNA